MVKVQPAPAPLPDEVDDAIKELRALAGTDPGDGLAAVTCGDIIRAHIIALTRRLAEVEGERDDLLKREDLLERTMDDKWRTRKYIVCRDYQLADMMAMCITALDQRDESEARVGELEKALTQIATKPDYTAPEKMVRTAKAALAAAEG